MDVFSPPNGRIKSVRIGAIVIGSRGLPRSQSNSAPPGPIRSFLIGIEFFSDVNEKVGVLHPMGFLKVGIGLDLLEPYLMHQPSDVIFPKGEHSEMIF